MADTIEYSVADDRLRQIRALYARAFADFGVIALWNMRMIENPTALQALAITRQLRTEGNMDARRLAEERSTSAMSFIMMLPVRGTA